MHPACQRIYFRKLLISFGQRARSGVTYL